MGSDPHPPHGFLCLSICCLTFNYPSCISSDSLTGFPPWTRASWDCGRSPSEQLQLVSTWTRTCQLVETLLLSEMSLLFSTYSEGAFSFFSKSVTTFCILARCRWRFHLMVGSDSRGWRGRGQWVNLSAREGQFCQNVMHSSKGVFTSFFNICLVWVMDLVTWDWHSMTKCLCFACSSSCEGLNSN